MGGLRLVLSCLIVLGLGAPADAGWRAYTIALSFPFPPWDVGPLDGVNYDLLTALCQANTAMRCTIVDRPGTDCFQSDAEGRPVVGPGLTSGAIDACMGWFAISERRQLGAEFTEAYSLGPTPQLIASDANHAFDGLGAAGSVGNARVGFFGGFFNSPTCLARHYTDFGVNLFDNGQAGHDAAVAALLAGTLDLVFWDSVSTVPAGTHLVGARIEDCGPHLAAAVFPPAAHGRGTADEARRALDCGLALIRANGTMARICAASTHPGGDPECLLGGPPPTAQCLRDNPPRAFPDAPPGAPW